MGTCSFRVCARGAVLVASMGLALAQGCAQGAETGGSGGEAGAGGHDPYGCEAPGALDCDGICVDSNSDAHNCGACGHACTVGWSCVAGECVAPCPTGLIECSPGECADIVTDHDHCGTCGKACLPEQLCEAGSCKCPGATIACGEACVDTATDPQHCGGCGNGCDAETEKCSGGKCTLDCAAQGKTLCGNECVDTLTDDAHCGWCFKACGQGFDCTGGQCLCPGNVCGACAPVDIGQTVPQIQTGSTQGASALDPSCADTGAPEAAFQFTAPKAGTYIVDTIGSSFDTTLTAIALPGCGELDCNDDSASSDSVLVLSLQQNDKVMLVVDGYDSAESGPYVLNVAEAPACPGASLGSSSPQTVQGDTSTGAPFYEGSCGGSGPELSYAFTAPSTGSFTFDTIGSTVDTVLHVRDGTCAGNELGCDDDSGGGNNGDASQLTLSLTQSQTVVVFVDSYSSGGAVTLHVSGP